MYTIIVYIYLVYVFSRLCPILPPILYTLLSVCARRENSPKPVPSFNANQRSSIDNPGSGRSNRPIHCLLPPMTDGSMVRWRWTTIRAKVAGREKASSPDPNPATAYSHNICTNSVYTLYTPECRRKTCYVCWEAGHCTVQNTHQLRMLCSCDKTLPEHGQRQVCRYFWLHRLAIITPHTVQDSCRSPVA